MREPRGDRLSEHVCFGPGPCPHSACRKNQEEESVSNYPTREEWREIDERARRLLADADARLAGEVDGG